MQSLITDHIDIWASAQTQKANGNGRGNGTANQNLYGIKKLRELILELAVRGKLVPQDPGDEPASVLLEKIAAEKALLVKEGKIKKEKPLPEISEDEKPFFMPDGWVWARLGEIFDVQDYLRVPVNIAEREQREGSYPYYGANGQVGFIDGYIFDGERVLLAEDGGFFDDPIRGVAYIAHGRFWVNNHAHVLECLGGTCAKFWVAFFNRMVWKSLVRGMTRAKLNQTVMLQIPLPLPPLTEQYRIVAKVDELMALCDQLDQQQAGNNVLHQTLVETSLSTLTDAADQSELELAWQRIADHFDTLFITEHSIDQLKKTILQLAVMGKLVPQDPGDEPASVLLKKIAKEKARLVKEGKIKKEKPLPEISEDEKPFELPDGWEWKNLSEILALVTDGDHQAPPKSVSGIPFLVIRNLNSGKIVLDGCKHVPKEYYQNLEWARQPAKGDILYTVTGSYGITIPVDSTESFCVQRHVAILKSTKLTPMKYLCMVLRSQHSLDYTREIATGIAQKTVPLTGLRKMPVPMPPVNEQCRILAKVDELMAVCDTLKARLNESQTTQIQLADAIVLKNSGLNEGRTGI